MNAHTTKLQRIGRSIWLILFSASVVTALTVAAVARKAPTDSNGCHFSEGEGYHCH